MTIDSSDPSIFRQDELLIAKTSWTEFDIITDHGRFSASAKTAVFSAKSVVID